MPTYEYECESCGRSQEVFQSISAAPLSRCESCDKETLRRKIGGGAATLRFRGSGFYLTDYRRSSTEGCPCDKESSCSEA